MEKWQDFFKIVYHPDGENYIVHWIDSSRPVDPRGWRVRSNAEKWVQDNWQALIYKLFEETILE
jgi:hypothetical protein